MEDSDANYSNEALQAFFLGSDAKIDDINLVNKKVLVSKQTPLTLVNQLVAKWKVYGVQIKMNEFWETRDPTTMCSVWHCKVGLQDHNLIGHASDCSKNTAKYLATQRFLKKIFPEGTTWSQLLEIFGDKNRVEELNTVLKKSV
jgi:hypothetical protein